MEKQIFMFLEINLFGGHKAICVKYERGFYVNTLAFLNLFFLLDFKFRLFLESKRL